MNPYPPRETDTLISRSRYGANGSAGYTNGDRSIGTDHFNEKDSFKEKLTAIDFFKKYNLDAPKELAKRTKLGAIWSILVITFLLFLFISECISFLRLRREDLLSVDKRPEGKLDIFFNITFPNVKCMDLTVDSIDVSGEAHIDVDYHIFKRVVASNGLIVEMDPFHDSTPTDWTYHGYNPADDPKSPLYCGSCGKAYSYGYQCCNTCYEVLSQYRIHKQTPPPLEKIEQCVEEASKKFAGCNMFGVLRANKVAGNFHFAPGRSFSRPQETRVHHIHEYDPVLIARYNTSHIVNSLSFGPRIPYVQYPLDGLESIVPNGMGLHKYFIKIVPTEYKSGWTTIDSYQFSYTQHRQQISLHQGITLPGVFFIYDLSPIQISYIEYRLPFLHFLVRVFAIIGGVFTVSGLVNRIIHSSLKKISKKLE